MVFGCLQEGLKSLQGKSVCEHLQTVLPPLRSGGKIHFSTSGPPTPDNSLLNNADFWGSASLQHSQCKNHHESSDLHIACAKIENEARTYLYTL